MDDQDLQALELDILQNPLKPPIMSGTGGLRKTRFAGRHGSRGKSGGVRVCYLHFEEFGLVYLCVVFPKNERANLTAQEKNEFRLLAKALQRYLLENFSKGWTP